MNNHFPPPAEKIVADYLEKLAAQLKGMNEKDRQEILAEIRSHIFESFSTDSEGDEIDRALRALKRLGEPSEVISSRVGASVSQLGRKKKSLLYILAGVLIVLFAAPLGMGGLAMIVGLLAGLAALMIGYFATAVALVVSGFVGALLGLIAIVSPDFFLEINRWAGEAVFQFGPFQSNPQVAGVLTLILSLMMAALGLLMLWSSKHIWRGLRFVFRLVTDKISSLFARGRRAH
jgi:uncharacterized membrane protein